jgi:hypothetical protein
MWEEIETGKVAVPKRKASGTLPEASTAFERQ